MHFSINPRTYKWIALISLIAVSGIIITGAAVRLTGSGLGCPDWPQCDPNSLAPHSAGDYHAMVEFVNRTVTGLVSVVIIVAVLGSLFRLPRRKDLILLSLGLVVGLVAQIVLGGLTVLFDLRPPFVMGHFLLSIALLTDAVLLFDHARRENARADVSLPLRGVRRAALLAACGVVFMGTVVTAAGPHGGDKRASRLNVNLETVARLHSLCAWAFVACAIILVWHGFRSETKTQRIPALWLLVLVFIQGTIGYIQYFTGVPPLLVGFHIFGAVAVWIAVIFCNLTPERVEISA